MFGVGIVLTLLAALGYTLASFFLKSALSRGATTGQVNFAANLAMALVTQPLWLLARPEIPDAPLWQPLLCCATFFIGQIFTFAALGQGDVSVATPVLGTKIVIVTALNAMFFGVPIGTRWWIAAFAASLGIAIIAGRAPGGQARTVALTAVFSLAAASFYSLTDVVVQHWAGARDEMAYLPTMFGGVGLLSTAYYFVTDRRAARPARRAVPPLLAGGVLLGLQGMSIFFSLIWSQDPTAMNIVYSSRSIWSVLAAWMAGWIFGLRDREAGPLIMAQRLLGSLLLFGAILLILL